MRCVSAVGRRQGCGCPCTHNDDCRSGFCYRRSCADDQLQGVLAVQLFHADLRHLVDHTRRSTMTSRPTSPHRVRRQRALTPRSTLCVQLSVQTRNNVPRQVTLDTSTRSHQEMVGDMSRVTLNFDVLKFLLCVSSQGQDLYSHQKVITYFYWFSSESGNRRRRRRQRGTP